MAFSVRGRRVLLLAFFSTFAALAVSFSLYYLINYRRGRKKGGFIDVYKNRDGEKTPSSVTVDLELAEILQKNGHGEFTKGTIYKLLELLEKVEDCTLEKLLGALLNCSAFTTNQVKYCVSYILDRPWRNTTLNGYLSLIFNAFYPSFAALYCAWLCGLFTSASPSFIAFSGFLLYQSIPKPPIPSPGGVMCGNEQHYWNLHSHKTALQDLRYFGCGKIFE